MSGVFAPPHLCACIHHIFPLASRRHAEDFLHDEVTHQPTIDNPADSNDTGNTQ